MTTERRYCFAIQHDAAPKPDVNVNRTKAALWNGARWPANSTITISFLGGTEKLRQRVQDAALKWIAPDGPANLTFEFRDDTNKTDIRIAFVQGAGSWSRIGTGCKRVPKPLPTMNFGWLTEDSSPSEVEGVVLHEFGHALGLIHEHQNPAGGIKWDKERIYTELAGPPNNWSREVVDLNLFMPWEAALTSFTEVDAASIMMYPIPKDWTTDGFTTTTNATLSPKDRAFIAEQYA